VITVRVGERGQRPDGSFTVGVVFEQGGEYEVTVADPGNPGVERELVWYFEEHLRFPFLDQDRERAAVEQISGYGQALFAQLFSGSAAFDYRWLRNEAFDGCRVEVSGSAAFHRLHWEALRDPEMDTPLALRLPVTRRVDNQSSKFDLPGEQATLNILVVTARPGGPKDVGYRTISRPLLTALRQAEVPVAVDMVRPGTWQALRTHLSAVTQARGSGWYHVVHLICMGRLAITGRWSSSARRGGCCSGRVSWRRLRASKDSCSSKLPWRVGLIRCRRVRWRRCWPSIGFRWWC
jgi:hypothetical protein